MEPIELTVMNIDNNDTDGVERSEKRAKQAGAGSA